MNGAILRISLAMFKIDFSQTLLTFGSAVSSLEPGP